MPDGMKHLIGCHCVLPQFRRMKNPIFHKFIVFSIIDDNDNVEPKLVKCNNCEVLHRVTGICQSEFVHGHEDSGIVISKGDIKLMLPDKMANILETYDVDLPTWEQAQFLLENQEWNSFIVLTSEKIEDRTEGKILRILGSALYKVESFTRQDTADVDVG